MFKFLIGILSAYLITVNIADAQESFGASLVGQSWGFIANDLEYRSQARAAFCFRDGESRVQAGVLVGRSKVLITQGDERLPKLTRAEKKSLRAYVRRNRGIVQPVPRDRRSFNRWRKNHISPKACETYFNTGRIRVPRAGKYRLAEAFPEIRFDVLTDIEAVPGTAELIAFVEKGGTIRLAIDSRKTVSTSTMLDISSKVRDISEDGLLDLEFHPDYPNTPKIYIFYSAADPHRSVISELTVVTEYYQANPATERVLLEIPQSLENHNGGKLAFGSDGFLYISVGDGGGSGDPLNNGQDKTTLESSILRIDPFSSSPYAIPASNPFVGDGGGVKEEIYAYGFRNAWSMKFDVLSGLLYAADVGQNTVEEVNIVSKGGNYGWNIREGDQCYDGSSCSSDGFIDPVYQYLHTNGNASITGGFVYHGKRFPELRGSYIFGDFVSARLWSLGAPISGSPVRRLLFDSDDFFTVIGKDNKREFLIGTYGGKVMRLKRKR